MSREIEVAITAAKAAGAILRQGYGKPKTVRYKAVIDLVTEFDEASEAAITRVLSDAFPDYGLYAEEGGRRSGAGDSRWIVDPLDGTTNFAHDFPHFAVSIALEHAGMIVAGVVYNPILDELFVAGSDQPATLNGNPISVSATPTLDHALVASGTPYDRDRVPAQLDHHARVTLGAQGFRKTGSAALDMCYVAAGRLDGYFERGAQLWDVAAGIVVVTAAGGRVTNYAGAPFDPRANEIAASNGMIHTALLDLLSDRA